MLTITVDLLKLIMSLRNNVDHGLWTAFTREFQAINSKLKDDALHFIPDPSDFNARMRQDVIRGASICADILTHALVNPEEMVESLVTTENKKTTLQEHNAY